MNYLFKENSLFAVPFNNSLTSSARANILLSSFLLHVVCVLGIILSVQLHRVYFIFFTLYVILNVCSISFSSPFSFMSVSVSTPSSSFLLCPPSPSPFSVRLLRPPSPPPFSVPLLRPPSPSPSSFLARSPSPLKKL